VENTLYELRKDYTIIIIPHSVQQAARVADYAAFLLMGELLEHQPGKGIFTQPRNQRTEDYVTGRFG
jgi:phosphate transport system ATP-binding protein